MPHDHKSEKNLRYPFPGSDLERKFNQMISPYYASLETYCQNITKSKWDADDLMQMTLTKVYRKYAAQTHLTISKAFLYKIAINTWIDECRRKKILQVSQFELREIYLIKPHYVDMVEAVEKMLTILTPKQSVCLFLHDVLQFTSSEIGEMIQISEGAVKSLLYRSRRNISSAQRQDIEDHTAGSKEQLYDEDRIYQFLDALEREDPEPIVHLFEQEKQITPSNQFMISVSGSTNVNRSTPSMMMMAA